MELDLQHEKALEEFGIPLSKYPLAIKAKVNSINQMIKKNVISVEPDKQDAQVKVRINAFSAEIADEMTDHYEEINQYNDEQTMQLTGEELARAEAVGLTADATIDQVVAAEEAKNTADAEAAATAAANAAAELQARADRAGIAPTSTLQEIEAAEGALAEKARVQAEEDAKPKAAKKHWLDQATDDLF